MVKQISRDIYSGKKIVTTIKMLSFPFLYLVSSTKLNVNRIDEKRDKKKQKELIIPQKYSS